MVFMRERNVINHAPTAHAIPYLNTKMNTLVNVNESTCASVGA